MNFAKPCSVSHGIYFLNMTTSALLQGILNRLRRWGTQMKGFKGI